MKIIEKHLKDVNQFKLIQVKDLVFDNYIRSYCERNTCGLYNKSWVCSTNNQEVFNLKRVLNYQQVLIFNCVYQLADSYDYETMTSSAKIFTKKLRRLSQTLKKANLEFVPFGLGGCDLCQECTYPEKECRHPDKVIFPVEAIDINVAETAKKNGFNYINGINTVTYFAMVFFKKEVLDV